jgi:hypothetical protein
MTDQQELIAEYGRDWVASLEAAEFQFQTVTAIITAAADTLRSAFSEAWRKIFGEANSLLEQFIITAGERIINNLINRISDSLLEKAATSFLRNIPIIGWLFHEGGTVPKAHGGAFVDPNGALRGLSFANIPSSKEFPILVRGGETIRTEMQEQYLQRLIAQAQAIINSYQPPSASRLNVPSSPMMPAAVASHITTNNAMQRTEITININGTVYGVDDFRKAIKQGVEEGMRRTGAANANDYFRIRNGRITL